MGKKNQSRQQTFEVTEVDGQKPKCAQVESLADVLHAKMASYLDVVQELHGVGIESVDGFDLPRIAVVGEQSSGKVNLSL